ncbi:MAG: hypothetical protein WAL41_06270 [Mycobacterium sp.]
MLARLREKHAAARARREAEAAKAEAQWKARQAAQNAAAAAREATRTIAAQIRAHPLDVTALGVRVDRYEIATPSGRWPLLGTSAKVTARSSRTVRAFGGYYTQQSALLVITGHGGELHERPLENREEVHAGELLAAHVNARSAALRLPRRQ